MSDVALVMNTQGVADFGITANDLLVDDGLQTAIELSLFTDLRALDTDVLPGNSTDRRGFWGGVIGSRLWLLQRSKQTLDVLALAKQYALEALQWLLDDQVAATVDVTTAFVAPGVLGISVAITRPAGMTQAFQFSYAWAAQAAALGAA